MKYRLSYDKAKIGFICALSMIILPLMALDTANRENRIREVVTVLTDSLHLENPVLLDIRCGEWTPLLESEMRRQLIARQADIRETDILWVRDYSAWLPLAMETDYGINGKMLLDMLGLENVDILELQLQQSVEMSERRNFYSYSRYNTPVYKFVLKQITLPEQQLVALQEIKLTGTPEQESPGSILAMKWYEPVIASALIGSLIYLLWTFK